MARRTRRAISNSVLFGTVDVEYNTAQFLWIVSREMPAVSEVSQMRLQTSVRKLRMRVPLSARQSITPRKHTPSLRNAGNSSRLQSQFPARPTQLRAAQQDQHSPHSKRLQIVAWRAGRELDLANATSDRKLSAGGYLSELVQLDGSPDQMSEEELHELIASFPLHRPERHLRGR